MKPYYDRDGVTVHHGDALDVLAELPDASVDAVVTDPPYSLSFMGRSWDTHDTPLGFQTWCNQWTAECLRVLKPGGHLLAFGSSRTYHRMTCAVEDAGFEIRDCITWHFGSGFPKSHNISAALDRIVPPDARCVCVPHSTRTTPDSPGDYPSSHGFDDGQPHQAEAGDRSPAPSPGDARARTRGGLPRGGRVVEPASTDPGAGNGHPSIAGSPLQSGSPSGVGQPSAFVQSDTQTSTSAAPEQEPHRTDSRTQHTSGSAAGSASSSSWRNQYMACRECGGFVTPQGLGTALKPATEFIVVARKPLSGTVAANVLAHGTGALNIDGCRIETSDGYADNAVTQGVNTARTSYAPAATRRTFEPSQAGRWPANVILDESQAAALDQMSGESVSRAVTNSRPMQRQDNEVYGKGLGSIDPSNTHNDSGGASRFFYTSKADAAERPKVNGTAHPTVKPLSLMRWLVRLVTPPGGTVLEPFAGSGTTVEACIIEGFRCVAVEREADYLPLIEARITRRRDPARAVELAGEDMGLLDLIDEETA